MAYLSRSRRHFRLVVGVILSIGLFSVVSIRGDAGGTAAAADAIVIDHLAVKEFDRLSDRDIKAAAGLRLLLRGASISWNIDQALNCMMNNFPDRPRRPYACDKGIPAGQVVVGPKYDRRNWRIEIRGNPGWYGKVSDFITRIDGLTPAESFDVVAFKFNYSDGVPGSDIMDHFFKTALNSQLGNVAMLEALEKRHSGNVFVWWSMALPRKVATPMQQFNARIRDYTREHHKVFFDLAAIESHAPDGSACTDNEGKGLEAICPQYTDERDSGHPNALGGQRLAKSLWVLMARLAARAQ